MEVIRVTPDGQRIGDGALGEWRVADREMAVLLEVGGFEVDRDVEMTMISHWCPEMWLEMGDMSSKLDRIKAVKVFKELNGLIVKNHPVACLRDNVVHSY